MKKGASKRSKVVAFGNNSDNSHGENSGNSHGADLCHIGINHRSRSLHNKINILPEFILIWTPYSLKTHNIPSGSKSFVQNMQFLKVSIFNSSRAWPTNHPENMIYSHEPFCSCLQFLCWIDFSACHSGKYRFTPQNHSL